MRILITGGAGFVGRRLARALIEKGHAVRVLDALVPQVHPGGERPWDLHPEVEFRRGDIRNPAAVASAVQDVDAVFHQAAEVGVGLSMYEIPRFVGTNSMGTAVLLQELIQSGRRIRKLVVASSMTAYGEGCGNCPEHGLVEPEIRLEVQLERRAWETLCPHCDQELEPAPTPETKRSAPTSVYAVTKRDQEELCLTVGRAYRIPTVALRYFNIYGAGQTLTNPYTGVISIFANRLLQGLPALVYEDGRQSRDFVHVDDVVQANLLALEADEADYQALNVSSGELWRVGDVARQVAVGLRTTAPVETTGEFRVGDIRHCHADLTRIRTLLGYEPRLGLREGLPEVLGWCRDEWERLKSDRLPTIDTHQAVRELSARGLVG